MWLKACLNGVRQRTEHPAVPETSEELRVAAERVAGTGVRALHLHPKHAADAEVLDSLEAPAVDAAVAGARAGAPGLPIGVTTGAWAMPEVERRLSAIARWRVLPDFASVNWHESGAEQETSVVEPPRAVIPRWVQLVLLPVALLALLLVAPVLLRHGPGSSRFARLHAAAAQTRRALTRVRAGLAVFRRPRLGAMAALFQLSAWALQWLSCWLLLMALGLDDQAGAGAAAAVLFAVNVTAVLPATPANIGVFQAAVISVLHSGFGVSYGDLADASSFSVCQKIAALQLSLAIDHLGFGLGFSIFYRCLFLCLCFQS